jgi:cytochrome b561
MPLRNTQLEYGTAAKWLHWLVALGIFALVFLGLLQSDMDSGPERTAIRELHGSIAMLLLVLMTLRLIWRWVNDTPGHPEGVPGWQRASAALVHLAIYIAVFVQLVSGALAVATGGKPIAFFGLFSIPLPVAKDRNAHELCGPLSSFLSQERRSAADDCRSSRGETSRWLKHLSAMLFARR